MSIPPTLGAGSPTKPRIEQPSRNVYIKGGVFVVDVIQCTSRKKNKVVTKMGVCEG